MVISPYWDWLLFPIPFDLAGIVAGVLKMPIWKFLLLCVIGKILKMVLFAYLGVGILTLFQ